MLGTCAEKHKRCPTSYRGIVASDISDGVIFVAAAATIVDFYVLSSEDKQKDMFHSLHSISQTRLSTQKQIKAWRS